MNQSLILDQSLILKDNRSVDKVFHASTESVIMLLDSFTIEEDSTFYALDIGTGSGILAMVVARKWKNAQVIATDISRQAVEDTRENIVTNGLSGQIECYQAEGLDHQKIRQGGPYRFIIANLLAEQHSRNIVDLQGIMAENGILILSGILAWRMQEVQQMLTHTRLETLAKVESHAWITMVLAKK